MLAGEIFIVDFHVQTPFIYCTPVFINQSTDCGRVNAGKCKDFDYISMLTDF